ncbi:MAG TPA: ABC transporter permease subunit [Planctomycetota bacterium]|nr:ABC transporter permease subunit [Planctomycetota bacterium]
MRNSSPRDRVLQFALALAVVAPLAAAFWGGGGLADAFATNVSADAAAARRWALAAATGRSVLVGGTATFIAALIGVPAAWALSARPMSVWRTALLMLPFALPAPVAISGWVQLIAPSATSSFALQLPGVANFTSTAHALLFSGFGAACVLGLSLWPVVALHAWPAFRAARDEAYESARLCATPARAFFRVVLPRCRGALLAGLALVFLLASSDFGVASLLLVKTLAVEVHDLAALGKNSAAAWASLPLVGIAAALCVLPVLRVRHGREHQAGLGTSLRDKPAMVRGGVGWFCRTVFTAGVLLGFFIPMLACLRGVISAGKPLSYAFDAGAESLLLSARLATAAVMIGCGAAAMRILLWPEQRAGALNAASVFVLAVPGSFLAAALLTLQINAQNLAPSVDKNAQAPAVLAWVFNQPQAWLACAFALRFLYVPLRLAEEALASIDPALMESAAMLGRGWWGRAGNVALPLSLGHLAAAAALVFTLALGEVPLAAVLAPPGAVPATIWLFNQQHMGYDESVFALSLLLGAVSASVVGVGTWAAKRMAA